MVDPDEPGHTTRLQEDLPVARALAEYAIEVELGVKSRATIYAEHLYELSGFKPFFDRRPSSQSDGAPGIELVLPLPPLSIRIKNQPQLPTFEAMNAEVIEADPGSVKVMCNSQDRLVGLPLVLDFEDERLTCDPITSVQLTDDGSVSGIAHRVDHIDLVSALLGNGVLEVWDAAAGQMLARKDAYIPVNIDWKATRANLAARRQALEVERTRRWESSSSSRPGEAGGGGGS